MRRAIKEARQVGQMDRTPAARDAWAAAYPALSADAPGLYGAVTARAEAHALRLALVYALMDGAARIDVPHLAAALVVLQYCLDSARHLFGDATGNPLADRIWRAHAAAIAGALDEPERAGRVIRSERPTDGRTAEVWRAVLP